MAAGARGRPGGSGAGGDRAERELRGHDLPGRRRSVPGRGPDRAKADADPQPRSAGRPPREGDGGVSDPVGSRVSAARRGAPGRRARSRQQARAQSGVLGGGRRARQRSRPPGRPRPPQCPAVRGGEEGRRARRASDRQPRDHRDARPRQSHDDDRERDRASDRLRPVGDRDSPARKSADWGRLRQDQARPEGPEHPASGGDPSMDLLQRVRRLRRAG